MITFGTHAALSAWLTAPAHDRRRYLRPVGLLGGETARAAVAAGAALDLAGGPSAFLALEIVERGAEGPRRALVPAALADATEELQPALHRLTQPRPPLPHLDRGWPIIMGVINVTPDSFSDAGDFADPGAAIAHGLALLEAGAAILDVGGESTRPGAGALGASEELRRVLPVISALAPAARQVGAIVSIDTRNALTMQEATAAGAALINDISALRHDSSSLAVARDSGVPVVLMHMQGTPETMQQAPRYEDAAYDVFDWLDARIAACGAAGIPRERVLADVGIGFGKTVEHNYRLLALTSLLHGLGVPLLLGASRKSFIGETWRSVPAKARIPGSLAAGLEAVRQGAQILRVHDVAETAQALAVLDAVFRQA
ncbi:MAG: dihydropteroate synthase [Proteobacteria bacterium]|nr:dihydropteroate synthase [Pseudomonadota bacterium]MBI3497160.1 dihydropteroate synthase [Pseudomonadota bacterium]